VAADGTSALFEVRCAPGLLVAHYGDQVGRILLHLNGRHCDGPIPLLPGANVQLAPGNHTWSTSKDAEASVHSLRSPDEDIDL